MPFATQPVAKGKSGSLFWRWPGSVLKIVVSAICGAAASALTFNLGVPKFIGLCIGAAVVGLVLALMKYLSQGTTTT